MFNQSKSGAHAYAKVGVETGVLSASPHELIVMLFDGAITSIGQAKLHMKNGNIEEKSKSITKAVNIINEGLRASLNKKVGGELAINLDDLYFHIGKQIMLANIRNEPALLDESLQLLNELRSAWKEIGTKPGTAVMNQSAVAA